MNDRRDRVAVPGRACKRKAFCTRRCVSICTFVLLSARQSRHAWQGLQAQGLLYQALHQYLYCCTSKASKLSTAGLYFENAIDALADFHEAVRKEALREEV